MDFSQNFVLLVIDTETTGLLSRTGNRVVELGVQMLFWDAQAQTLKVLDSAQWYFNPERASEPGAARVHRLSQSFLKSQPTAEEQIPKIINWIDYSIPAKIEDANSADVWLAAHNAIFDIGFLNSEMRHAGLTETFVESVQASGVLDTKQFVKMAIPAAKGSYSLNTFCGLTGVDTSIRRNAKGEEIHGALADCRLLASALMAALQQLGAKQFAAACGQSLLDANSVATMDSVQYPAFLTPDQGQKAASPLASSGNGKADNESALKGKCEAALRAFRQTPGNIAVFEAALRVQGVRLSITFADDFSRFSGTTYSDDKASLPGSRVGKEFSAGALMELVGYQRVCDWKKIRHHLPLLERLRSESYDSLARAISVEEFSVSSLPDTVVVAGFELRQHFQQATAIYAALATGEIQRSSVSQWLDHLRGEGAVKRWADGVSLFLNCFDTGQSLRRCGSNVNAYLKRLDQKVCTGETLNPREDIARRHPGAMLLCEEVLLKKNMLTANGKA